MYFQLPMSLTVNVSELVTNEGLLAKAAHWERVELNIITRILNGFPLKSSGFTSKPEGFPVIRIRDLKYNSIQTYYKLDFPDEYIVDNGDLLVGMDGDFNCYEWSAGRAVMNQRVCKLIPDERYLLKKFLYYGINGYLKAIWEATSATTVKHLSSLDIAKIPFPVPPLAEQARIVAALDGLFGRVRTAQEQLTTVPKLLKRFRYGVISAGVSGKLTEDWRDKNPDVKSGEKTLKQVREKLLRDNVKADLTVQSYLTANHENENWISVKLGLLVKKGDIFDGPFGSNLKSSDYVEEGVRVIRLENIGVLKFIAEKKTYISHEKYKTLERHAVMEGDLLISSFIADVVRCVILPSLDTKAIAKADCFCIRPIDRLIEKQYLSFFLSSEIAFSKLVSHIHGATRPRINTTQLKELEISLPPLAEQQEIVRRLSSLLTWADKLEEGHNAAKPQLDALPNAILAKALAGELTEPNLEDEPVQKMLDRIKLEKKSNKPKKPKISSNVIKKNDKSIMGNLAVLIDEKFGSRPFTFEELRAHTSAPYEDLKAEIFKLLDLVDEKGPSESLSLSTVFDRNEGLLKYKLHQNAD